MQSILSVHLYYPTLRETIETRKVININREKKLTHHLARLSLFAVGLTTVECGRRVSFRAAIVQKVRVSPLLSRNLCYSGALYARDSTAERLNVDQTILKITAAR